MCLSCRKQILDQIAAIGHALSCDWRPSLLLVGTYGIGRKNLVHLICHWYSLELRTFSMVQGFSLKQFKSQLKAAMVDAAMQQRQLCLFLEESQIVDERVINVMHDILSSGEVCLQFQFLFPETGSVDSWTVF